MLNNAGATLQHQLIAFAGCGTMKVLIACLELVEHVLRQRNQCYIDLHRASARERYELLLQEARESMAAVITRMFLQSFIVFIFISFYLLYFYIIYTTFSWKYPVRGIHVML